MTLGEQHKFTDVTMTEAECKEHRIEWRSGYMPAIRLVCACGWKSDFISQGQGEWNARKTVRILHLLENIPVVL
jgi:hypothetical protein